MRFWKGFLPNLTIALALVLLTVMFFDNRNPMMGFLDGGPFLVLVIANCVCAIATSVVMYIDWRKRGK